MLYSGFYGFLTETDSTLSFNDVIVKNKIIPSLQFVDKSIDDILSQIDQNTKSCVSICPSSPNDSRNEEWYVVCKINTQKPIVFYKNTSYYMYREDSIYETPLLRELVQKVCPTGGNEGDFRMCFGVINNNCSKVSSLIPQKFIESKTVFDDGVQFQFIFDQNSQDYIQQLIDI